jgi:preprotein translocase subunit YajC
MFALLWVLLIRPQRQKAQQQQRLLSSIEPGDEVLTVGGLYGIVREIDEEDDLIVEIAEGIQVRVARRAVGGVVKPEDDADVIDGEAEEEVADEDETVPEPGDADPEHDGSEAAAAEAEAPAEGAADEDGVASGEESVSAEPGEPTDEAERRYPDRP